MAETLIEVYIKIAQLIIILSLLILLSIRRKKYDIRSLNWFIYIFFFALLHGIAELVIYYIKVNMLMLSDPSMFRFNEFHSIPYSIGIMIIYLLTENIMSRDFNPIRMFFAVSLWTAYMTLLFYEAFFNYDLVFSYRATDNMSNTIFDVFQIYVMSLFTYVFFKSRQKSHNEQHRRATLTMFYASLIYVLSILYELGEDLLDFPNVYGALTLGLSFVVLAYLFIKYPYYIFSVPTEVYRIIITSNFHRSLVYNAELVAPSKASRSSELLASGIASIVDFMSDTTGSNKSLEYAYLGDRAILIVKGELVSGIIIADSASRILRSALKQLVDEFERKYSHEIINFNANISQFFDSKYIIARTFPFLESVNLKIQKGESAF